MLSLEQTKVLSEYGDDIAQVLEALVDAREDSLSVRDQLIESLEKNVEFEKMIDDLKSEVAYLREANLNLLLTK